MINPDDNVHALVDGVPVFGIVVGCGGKYLHLLHHDGTVSKALPHDVLMHCPFDPSKLAKDPR